MAADGEERLSTMYADVHYYFTEPSPRPASHRMDKESYVYLYRDAAQKRGRLEIANHAGTQDQDAFTGYLDSAKIINSFKHPTLVTVVVDGVKQLATPTQTSEHHWRLPSTDPRDEGKYLFRLHTLDIYFWTPEDARIFVQHLQHTLQKEQLAIESPPPPTPHANTISPVVQQLENVAISDPAYRNSQTRDSRTSTSGTPQQQQPQSPPPPPPQQQQQVRFDIEERKDPAAYTPLAYNPAAPAAPEKIAHREKTPPPPEFGGSTGLASPEYANQTHSPHPGSVPPPPVSQLGRISSPPYTGTPTSGYGSPPPGYGSPPSATSATSLQTRPSPVPASTHGYVPAPNDPNAHLYSNKPMDSPTAQILGGSYAGPPSHPLQHLQPQYADYLASRPQPPAGFSDYNYAQQKQHGHGGHHHQHHGVTSTGDTSIHNQVYRPTEEEHYKPGKVPTAGPGQQAGKWEAKAEKAEKGLNKLLRKAEKKFG